MAHLLKETIHPFIVKLTLNNPDQKNAITNEMIDLLESTLRELDTDLSCRVVILTGEGSAFSAGGDIKAMKDQTGMFQGESPVLRDKYLHGIQRIPRAIEAFQKPILALVNGAAVGAGCDLSMMCDLRFGDKRSMFAETFSRLGLVPGDGGTFFLQRVVGYRRAMRMFLTAESIKGKEAFDYGLLDFYLDSANPEEIEELCLKTAKEILNSAPIAIRYTKKAMKLSYLSTLEDSLEALATYQAITQRTNDHKDAIEGFLNKRPSNFRDS